MPFLFGDIQLGASHTVLPDSAALELAPRRAGHSRLRTLLKGSRGTRRLILCFSYNQLLIALSVADDARTTKELHIPYVILRL